MGKDSGVGTREKRGERGGGGGREKVQRQKKQLEITEQCLILRNRKIAKGKKLRKKREEAGYARYGRREV